MSVSPIDPPTDIQLQGMCDLVRETCRKEGLSRVHALLDLSLADNASRKELADLVPEPRFLYRGHYAGPLDDIDPWLIELDLQHPDALLALCRLCAGRPMLGFIVTPASLDDLLAHLRRQLEARDDEGSLYILRWADTRCLPVLHGVLDENQRARLLQGISAWLYMGREGAPARLDLERHAETTSAPNHKLPYQLTAEQAKALRASAHPDALLAQIAKRPECHGVLAGPPSRRYLAARAALGALSETASDAEAIRAVARRLAEDGLLLT
ncbi:DUF4123 domain-containing protein [Zestomonas carbonaria]|uniref:DUF4123 domain-containing protein n=1 Tax=Zestomonas carbonaria TaxID=2762745 RepID=A0A7U7ESP5_9GAMM|nr:DUF4123 domain-containing protein [Pseudomonas carbonaria]CAD5110459.1 hypothetical protein PSEWESI4_04782 [Pseudomonas carbonaria]